MRTYVSAPRAFVLICTRTICFAKTGLVGSWVPVLGAREVVCHSIDVARIQFPAANKRRDGTMVSMVSKACNESKNGKKDILLFVPKQNYC